jgi:hypothetical protein
MPLDTQAIGAVLFRHDNEDVGAHGDQFFLLVIDKNG